MQQVPDIPLHVAGLGFGLYFILILAIGYYAGRKVGGAGASEYYVAGRSIPYWGVAFTYMATAMSFGIFGGAISFWYTQGWAAQSVIVAANATAPIFALTFGVMLRRSRMYTIPDFFDLRFESRLVRGWSAVLITISYIVYAGTAVIGSALLLEAVFGVPYVYGVFTTGAIFIAYTIVGGMLAVIWTDVAQFITFFIGLLLVAGFALYKVGVGDFVSTISAQDPDWFTYDYGGQVAVLGLAIAWAIGQGTRPDFLTRLYAARSEGDVVKAMVFAIPFLLVLLWFLPILSGMIRVSIPGLSEQEAEAGYILATMEFLPVWLALIPLCGLFAAAISTADTQLVVAGTAVARDIYQKALNKDVSDAKLVMITRLVVAVAGIAALYIGVSRPALILEMHRYAIVILATSFLPLYVFGCFWRGATRQGAIAVLVVGTVMTVSSIWVPYPITGDGSLWALIGAFVAGYVVSKFTEPTDSMVQAYEKLQVKPDDE